MATQIRRPDTRLIGSELDPNEMFPVPDDTEFIILPESDFERRRELEYMVSPTIAEVAETLIDNCEHLKELRSDVKIQYFWKRNGGKANGKLTFGKCVKASGFAKFYSGADFLIWLAADHLRLYRFKRFHQQALTFHELKHAKKLIIEEEPVIKLRPHDHELFTDEYRLFGAWFDDLVPLELAVQERFSFVPLKM